MDTIDEEITLELARELALHLGHTFADVRTMRPGPQTIKLAESIIRGLQTRGVAVLTTGSCAHE